MSKTIKLVIEIDEKIYQESVKYGYLSHLCEEDVATAFVEGVPLEEVRTEIEALQSERYYFGFDTCKKRVLEIIDKHINKKSGNNEL